MKTKLATALSIAGVLSAGSAAALVNTQILDSSSEPAASAAVLPPPSTIDLTVPSTTIDDAIVVDATASDPTTTSTAPPTAPTTALPAAPPAAAASGDFLTAFSVGDSGVVTVDVVNGRLIIVKTEAAPGWTVADAKEDEPDHVEVKFASATVLVEFEARFDGATITPSVSSEAIPTAAPTAPAATGTTIAHRDDDDHEDHDDEDHDDDDHDDDDHDDHDDGDHDDEDERDDD